MQLFREFWHTVVTYPWLYAPFLAALIVSVAGFVSLARRWARGRPARRTDYLARRIGGALLSVLAQTDTLRRAYGGTMHALLFWGSMLLLVVSVFTHYVVPHTPRAEANELIHLALDVAMLAGFVGLTLAALRRYVLRRLPSTVEDTLTLALLAVLLVLALATEGTYVALADPPWADLAPLSRAVGRLAETLPEATQRSLYAVLWTMLHVWLVGVVAVLPFCKLRHLLTAPLSVLFRDLEPKGSLPPVDMDAMDVAESMGAARASDLPWPLLLGLDACTECGRCRDACPATRSGKLLDPQRVVVDLRTQSLNGNCPLAEIVTAESLWACAACLACEDICPVFVQPWHTLAEVRRERVAQGQFPIEMQPVFRGLDVHGNPWGLDGARRVGWATGLDVPVLHEGEQTDVLLWVGCAAAYDARNQRAARALVKILHAAGVEFAILGSAERCCGDPARRLGHEHLWQQLATANVATLNSRRFKRIVTLCPHCFNALQHEYPALGGRFEVLHASRFVAGLMKSGRLRLSESKFGKRKVVYHDPCYLGRANGEYAAPRHLLRAIPGLSLIELKEKHRRSLCCGGGGGRMWLEESPAQRVNAQRTAQVVASGADVLATACPYCLTMLDDGVRDAGRAIAVWDVLELLASAIR
ncbi:MAG: (Fe-S)-binding protein [Chloroflexota bacterium]|nr:(Fe-S)-binding protein [Chloroflexota bacterium]